MTIGKTYLHQQEWNLIITTTKADGSHIFCGSFSGDIYKDGKDKPWIKECCSIFKAI